MAGIKVYCTNLPKQVQSIKTARLSALSSLPPSPSTSRPGLGFKSRGGVAGPGPQLTFLSRYDGRSGARLRFKTGPDASARRLASPSHSDLNEASRGAQGTFNR
ncbi:hypothetical protein HGRIS_006795 [Hohenbuehelia grisea]|uniref:Uncharacterized protein n=1 Tax=Hohenbuehelia grisea TaxID=104357 RepID=A0ABR3JAG9_9AGAR